MSQSQLTAGNQKRGRGRLQALICLAGLWLALLAPCSRAQPAPADETVTLTVLATTDVHGNVWPYDYLEGRESDRGLAKVATHVKQVRARQPRTLVVDCGDTFQGTPLAYLAAEKYPQEVNPVVEAMNAIGYDAMAAGNHEFNFGLHALWRLKEEAQFPLLAANVVSSYHDSRRDFAPYVIRTVGGVRVAILGLVTPYVTHREPPEHLVGYEFRGLVETARRYVPELRKKADVVILIIHSGLGRDPKTGQPLPEVYPGEDAVWDIAEQAPGLDAIFFGHSHQELAGRLVNGVLLVQAKNWAQSVAEAEFVLARADGRWQVQDRRSRLVPMDAAVPADRDILELTRAAHERSERYLNTVVARLGQDVDGRTSRVEDNPLVELVQRAQLHYGRAEVSLASLFSIPVHWSAGPVTLRDLYCLYPYEHQLYTVELTGAQLKQTLEFGARGFKTYPWPEGGSPWADHFSYAVSYDVAEGVSYQVDLSRAPGDRIVNLQFEDAPLAPDRKLRVALNSYRWAGGGNYPEATGLRHAKVVAKAEKELRELILDYLREQKKFDLKVDNNWGITPPEARQAALDYDPLRP